MIGVISVILAVLIPVAIWYRKSYLEGPELTIEFKRDGGNSAPIGHSNKNIPDADGVIDMRDALQIFRLTWNFEIIIRNNSEYTAYYPQILFKENQPTFFTIEELNMQESIASKGKAVIKAVYNELEEAKGTERSKMIDLPAVFNDMRILLEYRNGKKSKFFTLYNQMYKSNDFTRRRPKGF
jgi:hypothetical protein